MLIEKDDLLKKSQCYLISIILLFTLSGGLTSSLIINGNQIISKESSSPGNVITALHTEITLNSGALANRINRGPHSSELYLNHFPHRPHNTPSTSQITSKSLDSSNVAINQSEVNHLLVNLTQNSKPLLVDKRFAETVINTTTISPDNEKVTVVTSTASSITTPSPLTHKKGLLPSSSSSTSNNKSIFPIIAGNIIDKSDSISSRQVSPLIYLSRDPTSPDKYEARGDTLNTDESNSESGIFNGTTRGSNNLENDLPPRRGQLREIDSNGGSSSEANPPINYSDTYNRNRYHNMQPPVGNSYGMSSPNVNSYYKYGPSSKPPSHPMSYSAMLSSPFSPSPLSSNMHSGSSYPGNPYSSPIGYSSQSHGFSSPKSPPVPYPLRPINSSEIDAMVAQLRTQLRPKGYTVTNQFANAGLGHNRYQPLTHDYYASSSSRGSLRSTYPLGPSSSLHNSNEGWPSISSPSVSSASSSPSSSASQSASTNSGSSSSSPSFGQSPSPLSSSQSSESGSSESGDEESANGSSGGGNSGQEDSDQPYHTNNYQTTSNQENTNDDNESPSFPQSNSQAATGPTPTELSSPQFTGNNFASNMLNYGKLTGESGGGMGLGADFTVTSGPDPTSVGFPGGSEAMMAGLGPDSFAHHLGSFPLDSVQSLDPMMGPTGFKSPHEYIHNYYDTEPKEKFRYVGRPGAQEYYNNEYQQSSRPSPYAPQNSMKEFMRVVDSVKHVVYKMKPLKTVASKMYRDFTDKMKKRIKSFRGPPGSVSSIQSPHHPNSHANHHQQHPQHHHHQHSVPLPNPGLGPSHLGPGGPFGGMQGIGVSGGGPFFQQGMGGMGGMGGFNPMALTAMSEMAGMKLPAPPGIGGSNGLGGLTGGGRLKGGLADMLGGNLGGNSNGDISSLINQYLGMKDGESNNNNNNNNNMEDNLMDELNQALISQLVGGLKLRREDGKNSQEPSKSNRGREGDLFDEDTDTDIDDEDVKEIHKFSADRRSDKDQSQKLFNDTGASNNSQIVSSVGLTSIEQLINSTDSDFHNTHVKNELTDGLTMDSNKSPVRLIINDSLSSYTKPTNQSESSKFESRIKELDFDKTNGASINSTSIELSSSADKLIALVNSTKQGNKDIKRTKRSSQLFIQHGNSDGRSTLITDDKLSTIVSQSQIVSLMPNGKGNTDKDLPSLSQPFGQQLTDTQRAMMAQLLTSSIDNDDSRGTPIKYLDTNDLAMFDHFSTNQLQHLNLSDSMMGISDPSELSLKPIFVYNNDQNQLMDLMNEEISKVSPYESQFPTLIDYMTPDGEIKSDEILKTKLLDLTNPFSFSSGNSLKSSHFSELSSLTTTPKPDIYLKIIEISPDEPLILDSPVKSSLKSTIQGSSKEQSKVTTINKINERVHFPPTKTTAKGDIKNVWKRFPTPIIWPIGSKGNNAKPKSSTNLQTKNNSLNFGFKLPKTPLPLPTLSPSLIETIKKPLSSLPSYGTSQTSNPSNQPLPFSRPPIIFILLKPKQNPALKTSPTHQHKLYEMIRKSNQKQSPFLDLSTTHQVNLRPSNSFNQINKGSSSSDDSISRLLSPINRKSTEIESSLSFSTLPRSSQLSYPAIKQSTLSLNNFDLSRAGKMIGNSARLESIEPSFSPSTTSSTTVPYNKLQPTPETPKKASKFLTDSLWIPTPRKTDDKPSNLKYSQPLESGSTSDSNKLKDYHNNKKEWIPKS
uniref:Uncharacterized protein n=1 Tax=Tetranychus urticae TaxID=32264 RepID=T1KZ01_TETUR